jgi:hypothetical protein
MKIREDTASLLLKPENECFLVLLRKLGAVMVAAVFNNVVTEELAGRRVAAENES